MLRRIMTAAAGLNHYSGKIAFPECADYEIMDIINLIGGNVR